MIDRSIKESLIISVQMHKNAVKVDTDGIPIQIIEGAQRTAYPSNIIKHDL